MSRRGVATKISRLGRERILVLDGAWGTMLHSAGLTPADYRGERFALHDFFFAKSIDALKPGGVLALVTSHFTLDKQNGATREYLSELEANSAKERPCAICGGASAPALFPHLVPLLSRRALFNRKMLQAATKVDQDGASRPEY